MSMGKFKRHKSKRQLTYFELENTKTRKVEKLQEKRREYTITENDRISYLYKINSDGVIKEVTCASFDLLLGENWTTIVYYDSYHSGMLHRHLLIDLEKKIEDVGSLNVRSKGTLKSRLTWAIHDLTYNYDNYKKGFMKRNKEYLKKE